MKIKFKIGYNRKVKISNPLVRVGRIEFIPPKVSIFYYYYYYF